MPEGPCVDRSAWLVYVFIICAEAVIHPTRLPGEITLLKESRRMTRPSVSRERREGARVDRKAVCVGGSGGSGAERPV